MSKKKWKWKEICNDKIGHCKFKPCNKRLTLGQKIDNELWCCKECALIFYLIGEKIMEQ